jgi:hypothetical protein
MLLGIRAASTARSCARTKHIRGRERWVILIVEITSYPETCAEHGAARSASASASSLSTLGEGSIRLDVG